MSSLVEEERRTQLFPGVAFADRGGRRRAVLARRPRLQIGQVIDVLEDSTSLADVADSLALALVEVEQTVDYYRAFQREIDQERDQDRAEAEQAERVWRERQATADQP